MESIPYLGHTIRRWQVGDSTFLAWPEAGARLMHWSHARADGSLRDIVHWPEMAELDRPVAKVRGGNPILFPFNARVFEGGEIHFWRDPAGKRRPMPMHGFARQGTFVLEDINDAGFAATLRPTDADREAYPFDYEFTVRYRFQRLSFGCDFILRNHGDTALPWSAGHHFYFTAPWTEGHRRSDYVIEFPDGQTGRQSPIGDVVAGPALPRRCPLDHPDLVDTFHLGLARNAVRFGPADGSEFVQLSHGTNAKPNADACFVTWTSDADAPYYCVEPWMGPPNAPGHGRGLHHVAPGATGQFSVDVAIG
jgi:galactose mutarotase-like enzyme